MSLLAFAPLRAQDEPAAPAEAPAASNESSPGEPRTIKFQFDGIPYRDAIERFAQLAGKPVIGETKVEGTMSFSDPQPYTYQEALDTFNLLLAMKGVVLIESERYLRLIPKEDLAQLPLKVYRGLESSDDVRPGEVVTVLLELHHLDSAETAEAVSKMLSGAGFIAPMLKGKGLIVTDRMDNVRRIRELIVRLDVKSERQRELETFRLSSSAGRVLAEMIEKTFGAAAAPKRSQFVKDVWQTAPPNPEDYVTVSYDPPTRTLVIFGPTVLNTLAKDLVERFETGGDTAGTMKIFYPRSQRAAELATMLREGLQEVAREGDRSASASSLARVVVDEAANRLIVVAPVAGQLVKIEEFVRHVDPGVEAAGDVPSTTSVVRVFEVKNTDPQSLAKAIRAATSITNPSGTVEEHLQVTVDDATDRVVVSGPQQYILQAEAVHRQLDAALPTSDARRTLTFQVGDAAEVPRLAKLAERLYHERLKGDKQLGAADASFVPEATRGRIIVTAAERQAAAIEAVFQEILPSAEPRPSRSLYILRLEHADAGAVVATLLQLIAEQPVGEGSGSGIAAPFFLADGAGQRVLVTATERQWADIQKLGGNLDHPPPGTTRELRIVAAGHHEPRKLVELLQRLLEDGETPEARRRPKPQLIADTAGRRVLVLATVEDHERIQRFVSGLDTPTAAESRTTQILTVHSGRGEELVQLLDKLYRAEREGEGEPDGGRAVILAGGRPDQIIVTGPELEIARVERILNQLEAPVTGTAARETRAVFVRGKNLEPLLKLVEQAYEAQLEGRPAPRGGRASIVADANSRRLVITGATAEIAKVEALIAQLETPRPAGTERKTRGFDLASRAPDELRALVEQVYTSRLAGESEPAGGRATFLADKRSGTLMVTGSAEELTRVEGIIAQLDRAPLRQETRVFQLNTAQAAQVSGLLEKAIRSGDGTADLRVLVDAPSNSLVVSGRPADLETASLILTSLDTAGRGAPPEIRIRDVKAEDPAALAGLVDQVLDEQLKAGGLRRRGAKILPLSGARRLIIIADAEEQARIAAILDNLDRDGAKEQDSRVLQLENADAARVVKLLLETFRTYDQRGRLVERIQVSADETTNQVVLTGATRDLEMAAGIVDSLERSGQPDARVVHFLETPAGKAEQLSRLLERVWQEQRKDSKAATEITLLPDTSGGRIIVLAPAKHVAAVVQLAGQLKTGSDSQERNLYTISLTHQSAAALIPIIQKAYTEQARGDPDADVTILNHPASNRLIVVALEAQYERVRAIAESLDTRKWRPERETRFLEFPTRAELARLRPLLEQLYSDEVGSTADFEEIKARFYTDPDQRRLVVTAPTDHLDKIEAILARISAVQGRRDARETKVFKFSHAGELTRRSGIVRELYLDAFQDTEDLLPADARFMEDREALRLVVTARPNHLEYIEEMLGKIGPAAADTERRERRVFELANGAEAKRIAPLVGELYRGALRDQPELGPPAAEFITDERGGRLIVTAKPSHLERIESILSDLRGKKDGGADQPSEERELRVLELKTGEAAGVAPLVEGLLRDLLREQRGSGYEPRAKISAEPNTNRLILNGPTSELDAIAGIVAQLDQGGDQAGGTRIFKLKVAQAEEVARLLSTAMLTDDFRRRPRISVSADRASNSVVVSGKTVDVQAAALIIRQLDSSSQESPREVRFVEVSTRDTEKLARVASEVWARQNQGTYAPEELTLTADPAGQRLIIIARPELLTPALALVEGLDGGSKIAKPELALIDVPSGRTRETAQIVERLFAEQTRGLRDARVTITPDPALNRLIVLAPAAQFPVLRKIVATLESQPPPARVTRTFSFRARDEVERAADLANRLYKEAFLLEASRDAADAVFVPDPDGLRVLVTARAEQIEKIDALMAQVLERPEEVARATRVYDLKTAEATELAETVRRLYLETTAGRQDVRPDQILVLADRKTNRLIVTAPEGELEGLEAIVLRLDEASTQSGGTRVFKLARADADRVAALLSSALTRRVGNRHVPRVSVGADRQTATVVISGDPRDLQGAAAIIEQLDSADDTNLRTLRVFEVKSSDARRLAEQVQLLYRDRMRDDANGAQAHSLIVGERENKRILVTATEAHLALIGELIAQLDVGPGPDGRQMQVFSLERNSASSVAQSLNQLFVREVNAAAPHEKLVVSASSDDRSIAVHAPGETLLRVAALVGDMEDKDSGALELRPYVLRQGQASEFAGRLTRLFEGQHPDFIKGVRPRFEGDATTNTLMVAASSEQFEEIDKLVKQLQEGESSASTAKTFVLQHSDANQVLQVLQSMFGGDPRRRGQQDDGLVRFSSSPGVNAVVVHGPPRKLTLAEEVIKSLDTPRVESRSVLRTVRLKKSQAGALVGALQQTLDARVQAGQGRRVKVTAEHHSNSVLLDGPIDEVQEALRIIQELDAEASSNGIEVRIYKLENGEVQKVSGTVNGLINQLIQQETRLNPGVPRPIFSVSADQRTGNLLVIGTTRHFPVVEQLIASLDRSTASIERDVQFLSLKNIDAFRILPQVQALFTDRPQNRRPFVEVDPFTNTLMVVARDTDIEMVSELVGKIDSASLDDEIQVRVLPLTSIPASEMAALLTNIYSQMTRSEVRLTEKLPRLPPENGARTDERGTPSDAPPAQAVPPPASLEETAGGDGVGEGQVGGQKANGGAATPGAAAPDTENPELGIRAGPDGAPPILVAVDKSSNALLIYGPRMELDQVEILVEELTYNFIAGDAEFRVFRVKEADPVTIANVIDNVFNDKTPLSSNASTGVITLPPPIISIVPDTRSRSLIVRAKPSDFLMIESIITKLDTPGLSEELRFERIPLIHANIDRVGTLLRELVTEIEGLRPGDPITVTVDARTRSVVIGAREQVMDELRELVKLVDAPPENPATEVAFLPLKKASAPQVAAVLQEMLRPASSGVSTPDALALQEQVRLLRIRNEAGEAVVLDLNRPIKILADTVGGLGGNRLIVFSTPDNVRALEGVVALLDTVPIVEGVSVRIVRLRRGDASTVAGTLSEIFQQGQRLRMSGTIRGEPEDEAGKALVKPLNVAVDRRTNTLILSGPPGTIALALGVIEDLDQELGDFLTDVKLFPLRYAAATQLAPILQSVFSEGSPVPGTEGVSTQVTRLRTVLGAGQERTTEQPKNRIALMVRADDSTNTLVVAARSDTMPLIADVIQTLDIPSAAGFDAVRIYPLEFADAPALQRVIVALLSEGRSSMFRPQDRPVLSVDVRTNALIVSGDEKAFGFIEDLLTKLDVETEPGLTLDVLPLKHNIATVVATSIRQIFAARRRTVAAAGGQATVRGRVDVRADAVTNTLIVSASKGNLALIRNLLTKLDVPPLADGSVLKTFPLEVVDAQRAAGMLRALVDQGLYRPGLLAGRGGSGERMAIAVDNRTNTLIISAAPHVLSVVEELIQTIDLEGADQLAGIQLFRLEHATASRLAPTLERFFTARRAGEAQTPGAARTLPVRVVFDDRTNTLLVSGSQESFETVERMVRELDAADVHEGNVFRVFPLTKGTASKVRATLTELFVGRDEKVTVVADPWANALIVSGSPESLGTVASLIDKLDTDDGPIDANIHVIPLAKARADSVAETIQALYRGSDSSSRPSGVNVTVDDRLNALVVSAGESDLGRIRDLAAKLDTDFVARVSEIRVFPLVHAEAIGLAQILRQALSPGSAGGTTAGGGKWQALLQFVARTSDGNDLVTTALQEGVLVTPDPRTNALVVSAPSDSMPLIEQMVATLDSSAPDLAEIKVFTLKNADAAQMAETLEELFHMRRVGFGGGTDGRSIRYRLRDGESATDAAEEFSQGKTAASDPDRAVVGDMAGGPGDDRLPATIVESTLTLTVDDRTNTLLVGGTAYYVELATEIIQRLDASPARQLTSRVYRLKNAQAAEIESAITRFLMQRRERLVAALGDTGLGSAQRLLEEEAAIVAEPASNTLLVAASPRYFQQIADLIEELDQPQPQVLIQTLIAEVTLDDSAELGMEWDLSTLIDGRSTTIRDDFGVPGEIASLGGLSAAVTGGDLDFLLRAISADGRLEVLSRPQILAADNQLAEIKIGEQVPQVTGSVTTELGNVNNVIEYRDVGVILKVTPRISIDGFVRMEVEPEISSLSSSSVDLGSSGNAPIFNQRSATTTVSVQDGHTIIIGGLISSTDDIREEKVPFLGDIPLLGALFRSRKVVKKRTELLIILTPHVIHNSRMADRVSADQVSTLSLGPEKAFEAGEKDDRVREHLLRDLNNLDNYSIEQETDGASATEDAQGTAAVPGEATGGLGTPRRKTLPLEFDPNSRW